MKSFLNYSKNRILYNIFRGLLVFLLVFLASKCDVKALSSGEEFSEFSTKKVALVRLFNLSHEMYLYGANNGGGTCSNSSYNLECWLSGELSLLTYSVPSNDAFTDWGMTIYLQTTLKKGVEYTLNIPFVTNRDAVSNAIMRESNISAISNNQLISAETTCNGMSCNYIWKIKPTSDITSFTVNFQKVSTGVGLSWFNENVYLFYYPRITASSGNDNFDALEYNQQVIIDQNQTIINQNNQTNIKLDGIQDALTDSSQPNTSDLENSAGWLPAGPVDSILNLPLTLFQSLLDNLGSSCAPVVVPIPYVNKNLTLPCFNSIVEQISGFSAWWNGIGVIASAFILYSYLLKLYKWVDDTLTFRENTWQDWGGV